MDYAEFKSSILQTVVKCKECGFTLSIENPTDREYVVENFCLTGTGWLCYWCSEDIFSALPLVMLDISQQTTSE